MKMTRILMLAALTASLAACGGGGGGDAPAPAPTPTPPPPVVTPITVMATSYENAKIVGNTPVALPVNLGGEVNAFALADFKRDGTLSLFTAAGTYNPATSTPSTATPGIFKFWTRVNGAWVEQPTMIDTHTGCIHPRKAVVADVNGDGKPDVIVACHGYDAPPFPGERMFVILSTPSGVYHSAPLGDYVGFFHSASLADIDGDGKIDIVATDNMSPVNSIRVFKGNGDGTFVEHPELAPQTFQFARVFTVELMDLNNDGKVDMIVGGHDFEGYPVQTVMNNGNTFNGGSVTSLAVDGTYGIALDFLVDGNTLYVARTQTGYVGASIQAIDLTTHNGTTLRAAPGATWTPEIVKYNGQIVSALVGRGV